MSLNCTISNIQFDYAFNRYVADRGADEHFVTGIPFQTVLMFKTICTLPDDMEVNTLYLKKRYSELFGVTPSQPSVSRIVKGLRDELGLIETVLNPSGNARLAWVRLTANGRKLQKLYMGSTGDWRDKPRAVVERQIKTVGKE
jgi:hypothetical protein